MATTINAYSVGLALDSSNYVKNSTLSKAATNSLKRDINAARTPAENYARKLDRLEGALRAGAISQGTFNRLVESAKHKMDRTARSVETGSKSLGKLKASLAGAAAGYVSITAAMRGGTWAVKLAADAEQASIAFEVLTKDTEAAARLLSDLRRFAAVTPFRSSQVLTAGRSLLAFGFSAEQVQSKLLTLGNISAATGVRLGELTQVVGKMRVQGRIFAEDLNQLSGRGINVLDGLAVQLGTTTDNVKKFAAEGKISFADLEKVLTRLGENDFGGMIERQSESIAGKWSTFNDHLEETGRLLGKLIAKQDGLLDTVDQWVVKLNKGIGFLQTLDNSPKARLANSQKLAAEADLLLRQLQKGIKPEDLVSRTAEANFEAAEKRREQLEKNIRNFGSAAVGVFKDALNNAIEENSKRALEAKEKLAGMIEDQGKLEDRIGDARENYERRIAGLRRAEAKDLENRMQKMEDAISKGPGSGNVQDLNAFMAKQRNQEIAREATQQAASRGGFQLTQEQLDKREDAKEELKKLLAKETESLMEIRKQTALLQKLNDNKVQKIRG